MSAATLWLLGMLIIALILVLLWLVVLRQRRSLYTIQRLSNALDQRSIDDLAPLNLAGVPTELLPLASHINDLLQRLDDAVQAQRRFIGNAAHQLRTPLTGLKLESELMLAGELTEELRQRAQRIKSVSDRLIRVGQQLLILARVDDSARPRDSFVRMDLCDWVRERAAPWIPKARSRGVTIQLEAPAQPVWVDADPLLLEELLANLMDNALRYAVPDGGRLNLYVGSNPPSLHVEDDGPGIAPDEAARLFDAFYRPTGARSAGSGLGLAIVREIARAHGGWWNVDSRPSVPGTRISIVFPGPRMGLRLSRKA